MKTYPINEAITQYTFHEEKARFPYNLLVLQDAETAILIDSLIKEITEEFNITTVVVTHDMNSVMEIGDYIIYMYAGRKLWEGDKSQILDTTVPELKEFIYANKLVQALKDGEKL